MFMGLYGKSYVFVLKKNFMLLIIAAALLVLTFGFWFGIPLFVIAEILSELNLSFFIQAVSVSISIGLLFSLFFIPINLKVSKMVGEKQEQSILQTFMRLQLAFVLVSAILLSIIFGLIIWVEEVLAYS